MKLQAASLWTLAPFCLTAAATQAQAQTQEKTETRPVERPNILVIGARDDDAPEKLDHILSEVNGAKVTVTKKTSTTKLDLVPTIIDNNQRGLFARTPGVLVSEQETPTQFNLSYRGLGNPQESEYVLVLQDGIPISTDWIGFPTVYYSPLPQSLSEVQLIRGGSSLLYGPNPAPAINFVSKRPEAHQPFGAYSENVGGSDGLFSTFNTAQGSSGAVSFRANLGHTHSDGQRQNAASDVLQGDLWIGYRPSDTQLWYVDLHHYNANAGTPGRISFPQFQADPNFSPTPFNHDWVTRTSGTLGVESDLGDDWKVDAKFWATFQNLSSRSAASQAAGAPPPATTTLQDEQFNSQGLDARFVKRWGKGNALTFGTVLYHDDAPFLQWTSTDIVAGRDVETGTPRLDQERTSWYGAFFAENVFRLPHRFHIVPSFRLEREVISIDEAVRPPFLSRPLIDVSATRTVPLFGLGAGFDFGHQNETYFSVSQGYRPLRFFDVASPFSNVGARDIADPSRSLAWEAGVHGTPAKGLFYDVSLFWIDFRNRIETLVINATDSVNQNSGDTRHRGFEGEISYDFLARNGGDLHLTAFGNLSLLDAEFTDSDFADRIGNTPAFAPETIVKYGISLRRDARYNFSLTGTSVGSQFFQDSNQPGGAGATFIPAKVAAYTVLDLSADYYISPNIRILGGVSNIGDADYYARVFLNGIEPAPGRKFYGGIAIGL